MKIIKLISVFLSILCVSHNMFCQIDESKDKVAFGGFSIVNTTLGGDWVIEVGGIGGAFITESLYLGGGGFGMSLEEANSEIDLEYGGIMAGYLWGDYDKTAFNFNVLGCYGGVQNTDEDDRYFEDDVWVVKPSVEVDFYVMPSFRIGIGGGYRWVMGDNIPALDIGNLSAPFGSITLRFGNWKL